MSEDNWQWVALAVLALAQWLAFKFLVEWLLAHNGFSIGLRKRIDEMEGDE